MALGMAYGNHGFKLDQGRLHTRCGRLHDLCLEEEVSGRRQYGDPEIDPEEIEQMRTKDIEDMSEEELKSYIHKLEVKAYALEGTVRILKAEGIEGLSNDENAQLIDARPKGNHGNRDAGSAALLIKQLLLLQIQTRSLR